MTLTLPIIPVPKPRMSQRDKWAQRPCVVRYRIFCDEARHHMSIPYPLAGANITFTMLKQRAGRDRMRKASAMRKHPEARRPTRRSRVKRTNTGWWTPAERDYLRENYLTKQHAEMGDELGRSNNAVRTQCWSLGLRKRITQHPDELVQKIINAYKKCDGKPFYLAAFAKQVGVSRQEVCKIAGRYGLTDLKRKNTPEQNAAVSKRRLEWYATHEHPRGATGMRHTLEARARISEASRAQWKSKTLEQQAAQTLRGMKTRRERGTLVNHRPHTTWKQSWHTIGGKRNFFRSTWEVNYAHYMEWLKSQGEIREWEYEPTTFWFEKIKRGVRSYTPDFRITEPDGRVIYHEVKGWMDDRSKTKIKRMAKYHPDVHLIVVDSKAYKALARKALRLVPGWK